MFEFMGFDWRDAVLLVVALVAWLGWMAHWDKR